MIKRNNLNYNVYSINEYVSVKNINQPIQVVVKDVILISDYKLKIIYSNGATKDIEIVNNSIKKFEYVSEGNKIIIETNNNDEFEIEIPIDGSKWELVEGLLRTKDGAKITLQDISEIDSDLGAEDKFLNKKGEFATINTSSIGVTGSELYMSIQDSDVAGYKLLSNTIDVNETEITLTANSSQGIVWGNKYLTHEYTATTIPSKSWGFDYWRKVSSSLNNSTKHLRVFIYRGGIETDIISLTSPDINDTDFVERQVVYTLGAIELQQGDRIGVQEGFSTTRVVDATLTYIIGDGRGWFMRVPLAISHKDTTDKNAEPNFQHVTQEEKTGFHTHNNKEYLDNYNPTLFATALQGEKADSALQSLPPNTVIDADYPTLKDKVNGIEENANNYQHPDKHPTSILEGVDTELGDVNRFLNKKGEFVTLSHNALNYRNGDGKFQHVDVTTVKQTLLWDDKLAVWAGSMGKVVLAEKSSIIPSHSALNDKNAETAFQHVTQEEKDLISSTATIVNGHTEDILDLQTNKADKATTLSGYAITDAYTKDEIDTNFENHKTYSNVTYDDLLTLINNNELVPNSSYRITNYTTTTVQADTQSAGHDFDIIVTALSTNELSETASCVKKADDTYFANAKLEAWEIKYCIVNDTNRFGWADASNGKGVIYYMKDEWNNECPYDFKNIQFKKSDVFLYTFGGTTDDSLAGGCYYNTIMADIVSGSLLNLNFNTFGNSCSFNTFGTYCTFNTFGDACSNNIFVKNCVDNTFGNQCYSNTFGNNCYNNTFGNECDYNTFGYDCSSNSFGDNCNSNTFGDNSYNNIFNNGCDSNTFGNDCDNNTFGNGYIANTFGNGCSYNNFYTGVSGTIKKNYIQFIVLEDGCTYNNFYSELTTSPYSYLQRIRIKGLNYNTTPGIQITLPETNTNYEWVIAGDSSGVIKQYCPEDRLANNYIYKIEDTVVSTWAASTAYAGYGYQAQINITNLNEADSVNVVFGVNEAISGNYAPAIEIYSGYILVFSKVNNTITIPTIEITKIEL